MHHNLFLRMLYRGISRNHIAIIRYLFIHKNQMRQKVSLRQTISWLPSLWIAYFFIDNGLRKVLTPGQQLKAGLNHLETIIVGVILLLLVVLFLIKRTAIWAAFFLGLYMLVTIFQHLKHGKPFDMTAGILVLIISAILLRFPKLGLADK